MNVLHIIWNLGQGGAQTYLINLVSQLQQREDIENEVLVLSGVGPMSESLKNLGIPVEYLNMRSGTDIAGVCRLYQKLRLVRPDIIHCHSNNLSLNLFLPSVKRPIVYTEHGGDWYLGKKRATLIYCWLGKSIRRYIAISSTMAKMMKNINPRLSKRITVVHNGVKTEVIEKATPAEWSALPESFHVARWRVGIIGRLVPQKGIDMFLETAAVIAGRRDDVVFVVVGEGPLRERLERQACQLEIADRVLFLGYRKDAINILKRLNVFLFTSNTEPFGLVITEAMAAGIPVVALHQEGAVPEIIDDTVDGFIVESKNPEKLAARVLQLIDDPKLHNLFTKRACEKVKKQFTISKNACSVAKIYKECLKDVSVV